MLTGRYPRTFVLLAAASLLAGCAQPGPILSRLTTIGTLKTSLSHLEFENQQLSRRWRLSSRTTAISRTGSSRKRPSTAISRRGWTTPGTR